DLMSKRANSPRGCAPTTKIFLPSRLGSGTLKLKGPVVNGTGWGLACPKKPRSSRKTQISERAFRWDSNTKYFPSVVQLPEYSSGGLFHPGSKGWGLLPSAKTSHRALEIVWGHTRRSAGGFRPGTTAARMGDRERWQAFGNLYRRFWL